MSGDPLNVQLGRLDERLKIVIENQGKEATVRGEHYKKFEEHSVAITQLTQDMSEFKLDIIEVKAALNSQAPTIEEFITIKHKVIGAGKIGRWLWVIGTALIGMAGYIYKSKEVIGKWLLGIH